MNVKISLRGTCGPFSFYFFSSLPLFDHEDNTLWLVLNRIDEDENGTHWIKFLNFFRKSNGIGFIFIWFQIMWEYQISSQPNGNDSSAWKLI